MSHAKALCVPEILDQIISKFDDRPSLLAGALVCSDWLYLCRAKTFSGKVFGVFRKDWAQHGKDDVGIITLLNSPLSTLRSFLTAVHIYIKEDEPTWIVTCSLLTQCGLRLSEIQLEWDSYSWRPPNWGGSLMECVQAFLRSTIPTLQTCRLLGRGSSRISTCLLETLSSSTALHHIVIKGSPYGDTGTARLHPPSSLRMIEVDKIDYSDDVIPSYLRACGPDVAISVTNMMSMVGGSSDIQDYLGSAPGRKLHLLKIFFDYMGEYEGGMDTRQFLIDCGNRISHLRLILSYPIELDLSQMKSLVSLGIVMRLSSEEVPKNMKAVDDSIRSLPPGHVVKSIHINLFNFTRPRVKENLLVDQVVNAWMSEMSDSGVMVRIEVRSDLMRFQSVRKEAQEAVTLHVEETQTSADATQHEDQTTEESEADDITDPSDSDDASESEFSESEYAEQLLEISPDEFPLCLVRSRATSGDFSFAVHRPDHDMWALVNEVAMEGYP